MEQRTMRAVQDGEVPIDGGTAVQIDPDRPVFRGNGAYDYVCVSCGNRARLRDGSRVHDTARARPLRALPHD